MILHINGQNAKKRGSLIVLGHTRSSFEADFQRCRIKAMPFRSGNLYCEQPQRNRVQGYLKPVRHSSQC